MMAVLFESSCGYDYELNILHVAARRDPKPRISSNNGDRTRRLALGTSRGSLLTQPEERL